MKMMEAGWSILWKEYDNSQGLEKMLAQYGNLQNKKASIIQDTEWFFYKENNSQSF